MKKIVKVLAFLMCATLLVCGGVFGTLAYLTSQTDVVTNTFTFGGVLITLDEAKIDTETGIADHTAQRVKENTFKLMPGKDYDKDPTIHVNPTSEDCYIYVKVQNDISLLEEAQDADKPTIRQQMNELGWVLVPGQTNVYMYNQMATTDGTNCGVAGDYRVFNKIYIAPGVSSFGSYSGATIKITGYAIQADGFTNAEDAWKAAHSSFN